jgi:hypothetical protein
MKKIMIILLLLNLTGSAQSQKIRKINQVDLYANALHQLIKFTTNPDLKPVDTLFIELNDSIDFKLPNQINGSAVKVLSFNKLIKGLKGRPDARFLRILLQTSGKKTQVITKEVSVSYSANEAKAIAGSEVHIITYFKNKKSFLRFKKIEKSNTGCNYIYRITEDGRYGIESICT